MGWPNRFRAAAERKQGAVERAQRGHYHPVDRLPEQSHRAVHDLRGMAQKTYESAAGVVALFIEAKQGELAAHRASIQVYEQLAEPQEQLGHPDRAAKSRANAERARDMHRVAAAELAE